ncbi:MAG: hypothetical protein RMH84_02040 [Sulfolobales archaeon]|nr:hypothetical protein [Sulfolobales archaeon]MCX8208598.1 hypothetical protein [Sulfolobales archaeon]MDW8010358.1 hypothetical protein [Sulfolobales archaeon]
MRPIDLAINDINRKVIELSETIAEELVRLVNMDWNPEYYRDRAAKALKLKEEIKRMTTEAVARFQPTASDLSRLMFYYEVSYGLFRFSRYALDISRFISAINPSRCGLEYSWKALQSAITLVKLSIKMMSTYLEASKSEFEGTAGLAEALEKDVDEILSTALKEASRRADVCLMADLLSVVFLERIADHSIYMMRSLKELWQATLER